MTATVTGRVLAVLPAGLVPLAWGFAAAVAVGAAGGRALAVGLGVMVVLFAVFAAQPAMGEGALAAWRLVIVAGLVANLVSLAGLFDLFGGEAVVAVSAYAWMLLPVPALVRTGRAVGASRRYLAFAVLSTVGAGVVLAGTLSGGVLGLDTTAVALVGVALVGLGQTGSIVDAALRDDGALGT
ncbi:hypothetical protein BRD13_06350 [Halobacteriales archaeon SW_5_70_135]|nr:MAG: hypothetical protein BRD13_06350 [Halobacteriales archaeon SW_5_70_135]